MLLALLAVASMPTMNQLRSHRSSEEITDSTELEDGDEVESAFRSERVVEPSRRPKMVCSGLRSVIVSKRTCRVLSEWDRINGIGTHLRT